MSGVFIPVIGEITAETYKQYVDASAVGGLEKVTPNFELFPVLISSPGGDIGYTLAMLDDIDFWKRTTFATGICQSAAAVLATAGEGKRICTMDTLFRFLKPSHENEVVTDYDHFLHSVFVARLAARLKCERVEIEDIFDGEFISSIRAQQLGLIDEVISTGELNGNPSGLSGSESGSDSQAQRALGSFRHESDDSA